MKARVLFICDLELEGQSVQEIAQKFDYLNLFTKEAIDNNYVNIVDIEDVYDEDNQKSIKNEFCSCEYNEIPDFSDNISD